MKMFLREVAFKFDEKTYVGKLRLLSSEVYLSNEA